MKRSNELLNLRSAHGTFPSLGLQIDHIQPQPIFLNNAINPFIAALTDGLARVRTRTAVSERYHGVDNQPLEELGRISFDPLQYLRRQIGPDIQICFLKNLFRSFYRRSIGMGISGGLIGL